MQEQELQHYGVVGMKWGVRRNLKRLGEANSSGDKGAHNKAVTNLSTHRDKINKKLSKLDSKTENLEKRQYGVSTKIQPKVAKYKVKAAKMRVKNRTTKANKLDLKVAKMEKKVAKVQAQIAKNERLKKTFNSGLSSINKELVTNGQDFLYTLTDD